MGWSIGFDSEWDRDIGYGVPALCDHPGCGEHIDRGLAHVCGGAPYGGKEGCGLFFCGRHLYMGKGQQKCWRCFDGGEPFEPTPDLKMWTDHKMTHESWAQWRAEKGLSYAESSENGNGGT